VLKPSFINIVGIVYFFSKADENILIFLMRLVVFSFFESGRPIMALLGL
jgi:hypothetical protein